MKTKEEILEWSKNAITAMQTYADQEVAKVSHKFIESAILELNRFESNLAAKDKEIQELMDILRPIIDWGQSNERGGKYYKLGERICHKIPDIIERMESENASLRAEVERLKGAFDDRVEIIAKQLHDKENLKKELETLKTELARRDQPENFHCNSNQA